MVRLCSGQVDVVTASAREMAGAPEGKPILRLEVRLVLFLSGILAVLLF
jgi:hypothetical protein